MFKFKNEQRGLIKWLFLIIIAVIILSYFGFDLRSIIESEQSQANFEYLWGGGLYLWENYLSDPILYFWHNIFLDLLWSAFVENLDNIKNGQSIINSEFVPELF